MTVSWRRHPQFDHVALCDEAAGLAAIEEPDINLVLWHRHLDVELIQEIDKATYDELPDESTLAERIMGTKPVAWHERLFKEVNELSSALHTIIGRPPMINSVYRAKGTLSWSLGLNDSQRFHTDGIVGYTMLVTWRGPGTEWVPNGSPVRSMCFLGRSLKDRFTVPACFVQRVGRGEVMLMRGIQGERTILHRAPRIPYRTLRLRTVIDSLPSNAYSRRSRRLKLDAD